MVHHINVLIDDYADMNMRSRFVLNGIHENACQKKVPVQTFFSTAALLKALSSERRKFVIVISESKIRSERLLGVLNENGVHPIFIQMQFPDYTYSYSSILPDFFLASYQLTMAILSEHSLPCAFIGYNRDSFADKNRLNGFKKAAGELQIQYKIYSNDNGIKNCLDKTMVDVKKYKNLICIGDAVAIPLIKMMKTAGINPGNFNIASLRNMKIGEFSRPSLTSVDSDYSSEGMAAVDVYMFLLKKKYIQNLYVHTDSRIIFRESTHLKKNICKFTPKQELDGAMVDFYGDSIVKEIDTLERMFVNCDDTDMSIIRCILKGFTYEKISEFHSMAVNTIKYRVKKMEHNLNVKSRREFLDYLKQFDFNI